jgi:hypothetical protein
MTISINIARPPACWKRRKTHVERAGLLGVIQIIDRNGDDAGVALGELVVMRFELT